MGPLAGVKVIELAGIGPGPFAGMLLADYGAEVVVVERPGDFTIPNDCSRRSKRSIALNLKTEEGIEALLKLVEQADVLFEGYRPGVAERLGVGPDVCLARNPKLIYGRMTGWGQTGPMAKVAGHDINYISLTGALHATGRAGEKPVPPLNLAGDFGGGGVFLVMGILAALYEAQKSGVGQVIDAAMTEGSAVLMAFFHSMQSIGAWSHERGSNIIDSGAHFYDSYETADGKYISLGAIEPQFYQTLLEKAELDPAVFGEQMNAEAWPEQKKKLEMVFKDKTQQQWCEILEGSDACFAPVLNFSEAPSHPHNMARNSYVEVEGMIQPAPAPKFSRTPSAVPVKGPDVGVNTDEVLLAWGFSSQQLQDLRAGGAIS
ncbi:MAG: CaiB/BaiF CoA transferase family protein [Spongiibacteraceae bacterium]